MNRRGRDAEMLRATECSEGFRGWRLKLNQYLSIASKLKPIRVVDSWRQLAWLIPAW
jgi:hypothetical protein